MDLLKPYLPHLDALRWHLVRAVAMWLLAAGAVFGWRQDALDLLTSPLLARMPHATLLATGITEMFGVYLRIALWGGLVAASPYIAAEAWSFIRPALYPAERRWVAWGLGLVPLMSLLGALFAWFLLLPAMLAFFLGMATPGITTLPHVSDYISFVVSTVGLMALAFNMPLVLVALVRLGVISVATLRAQRRIVIVGLFIVAAIVTPTPDPINQTLVALPLWMLFEMAIGVAARLR